jgi:hypothetical protein
VGKNSNWTTAKDQGRAISRVKRQICRFLSDVPAALTGMPARLSVARLPLSFIRSPDKTFGPRSPFSSAALIIPIW